MLLAHPTKEMLRAYAAGDASDGVSLLVAAHLTFCPDCRVAVARRDDWSAALMAEGPAEEMSETALGATLARLDFAHNDNTAAVERPPAATHVDTPHMTAEAANPRDGRAALPSPVSALLPAGGLRWRFRMPGVSEIALPSERSERVSLLRVRPGSGVPAHTHEGEEATLVLAGSMVDRGVVYRPGDLAIAGPDDDHQPRAGQGEDCICLTVLAGGVRFTGTLGRALNLIAE